MSKLTLNDLASLQNEQSAISLINRNSALIETALENTLSRDGSTPNQMTSDLDMNGKAVLNSTFELAQDFQFAGDFSIPAGRSLRFSDGSSMSSAGVSNTSSNVVITRGTFTTNFTPLSPGGSISVGTNTVTLTPVPSGLNGTDTNHYVYLSGGTGTAEAVKITGGTAVSGGASGTITFTAANTHTGAWTVSSATGGIDEMLRLSTYPVVALPNGTYNVYATITPPDGANIRSVGSASAYENTIQPVKISYLGPTNTPCFNLINDNNTLSDLAITCGVTAVAGCVGVKTSADAFNHILENLTVWSFYNNLDLTDASGSSVQRVASYNSRNHGIVTQSVQGRWFDIFIQGSTNDALKLDVNGAGGNAIPFIQGLHIFNNGGWGVHAIAGMEIDKAYINFDYLGEVFLDMPVAGGAGTGKPQFLTNSSIEVGGGTASFGTNNQAPGVKVSATSGCPIALTNVSITSNQGNGLELNTTGNLISGCRIFGNGLGAQAGFTYAILSTVTGNTVLGNRITGPSKFSGGLDTVSYNFMTYPHATIPALEFGAGASGPNIVEGNTVNNPTGGGIAIKLNVACTVKAPFSNNVVAGSTTSAVGNFAGQLTTPTVKITGAGFGSSTHTVASAAANGTITWPVTDMDFSTMGGAFPVSGKAAGLVVKGNRQALGGSNPTAVATGMTSISSAVVTLEGSSAPGVGTTTLTCVISGSTLNVYAWKPTSSSNPTLIASTGTENFDWFVTGT